MLPKRFLVALVVIIMLTPIICGQGSRSNASSERNVCLVVNPLDGYAHAMGLREEHLRDAATRAIERKGWKLDRACAVKISVTLTLLAQTEEDLFPFRITVHGGSSSPVDSAVQSGKIISVVPGRMTVSVPWRDHGRLLSAVGGLTDSVLTRLQEKIAIQH